MASTSRGGVTATCIAKKRTKFIAHKKFCLIVLPRSLAKGKLKARACCDRTSGRARPVPAAAAKTEYLSFFLRQLGTASCASHLGHAMCARLSATASLAEQH
jgi:hypothetical protein